MILRHSPSPFARGRAVQFRRWTTSGVGHRGPGRGGERACGGIRLGGRELDGPTRLVKAACGMPPPFAKAYDDGVGRSLATRAILSPPWHNVNVFVPKEGLFASLCGWVRSQVGLR